MQTSEERTDLKNWHVSYCKIRSFIILGVIHQSVERVCRAHRQCWDYCRFHESESECESLSYESESTKTENHESESEFGKFENLTESEIQDSAKVISI